MLVKSANALILLALAVIAALAVAEIEPYLNWLARSRRKQFCARVVAGKMGEASQLIPEDSRTAFIHGAKEIPASCEPSNQADEVLIKYADGKTRTIAFVYEKTRFAPWKHARLVSAAAVPPVSP